MDYKSESQIKSQIKAHVLRHVDFEGLGNIGQYFKQNNIEYTETQLFNNEPLPKIEGFDLLIIMGGPMGIFDDIDYPFLVEERKFISQVINQGIKVIGVCLGSQFLANSLGGKVFKGPFKEIGWFPVDYTQEFNGWIRANSEYESFEMIKSHIFQWHGDTFSNPKESIPIGFSKPKINQGFIYKNQVLALQFHIEMTKESVGLIVDNGLEEIEDKTVDHTYIQKKKSILEENSYYVDNYKFLVGLFDAFLNL